MTEYRLLRSARASIAIQISEDGGVIVRAPHRTPIEQIEGFMRSKQHWIDKHCAQNSARSAQKSQFCLSFGSNLLYKGEHFQITAREGKTVGFDGKHFYLPPHLNSEQIRRNAVRMYKALAQRDITAKVEHFSQVMQVKPSSIKINGAKARWGSCSAKGGLNFSWYLIMAQPEVVDYVVVHELAHIKQLNHSAQFWAIVGDVLPDYKQRRAQLIELQHLLATQNWE